MPMMTLWAFIGIAILCGLGKWQLDRLQWKLGLIAAADSRSHAPPIPLDSVLGKAPADAEYTHIVTAGEFIPGKRAYLFSQLEDGRIGFQVLEPMRLTDGRVLIIDRGFVPQVGDRPARSEPAPVGTVQVTGLWRGSQKPGPFTPSPDFKSDIFYVRDVAAIASALGVKDPLPVTLTADRSTPKGIYPEGGHTRLIFRNEHLQYAVTWFALALVLLVMYLVYHWKRGRLSFGTPEG